MSSDIDTVYVVNWVHYSSTEAHLGILGNGHGSSRQEMMAVFS